MRRAILFFVLCLLPSISFAMTDFGAMPADKTLGYYLMPSSGGGDASSGLVFSYRQKDKPDFEAIFTSYKSAYLLTKNMSQLILFNKYRLVEYGFFRLSGLIGLGGVYSPAVGGGLTGNIGGEIVLSPMSNFKLGLPAYFSIFNDGFMMTVCPQINYCPAFMPKTAFFLGGRIDASMVGTLSSMSSASDSGKVNTYGVFGFRQSI
ncbi:MAG: hypothetical protein WCT39_04945 [Candidatus Margulisiibacteriota bacterium]